MGHTFSFSLQRHDLPNDSEELKELILLILKTVSEQQSAFLETIEFSKAENILLKRFRYGQSSERKKKF